MEKSNKKNRAFLLLFIFLLTAVLTIGSSFTLSKFTQTKNTGEITIEMIGEAPVLYRDFATKYSLKTDGTTKIVFDSWNNQKAELGLTDEDWVNNTNNVQESETSATASTNLRDGIKVFKVGTTAYVLAKGNYPVTFPVDSSSMFSSATAITSIGFNSIDTSKVTRMSSMFYGCSGLTELDLSGFNTSKVTNMSYMFNGCSGLRQLTFGEKFDTSSVTDMERMFNDCSKLTALDVSGFDTGSVKSMTYMFYGCSGLTELDLSEFDTSKVTNMSNMFQNCSGLTKLDLSKFDTSSVTNMSSMFTGCSALRQITLGKDFRFVGTASYLPDAATGYAWYVQDTDKSLTRVEIANNQTTVTTATTYVQRELPPVLYRDFATKYSLKTDGTTKIVFDSWNNQKAELGLTDEDWENNTNNVQESASGATASTNLRDGIKVFKDGTTAYVLAKGDYPVTFPANSGSMFSTASALESIEFNSIDTSKVTSMSSMFSSCSALTSLDLSGFNTSKVTNMSGVFYSCSGLTSLDLSGFNTSNVTDMDRMFYGCSGLTSLDLSGFNTSNVTTMLNMFQNCSGLTLLDLSSFNTSKVITMLNMFQKCSALTTLDLSSFDTGSVTNMAYMFDSCSALRQITLGKDFRFVGTASYLPDAAIGYAWYVKDTAITLTPAEIATNQTTVTTATTYVQQELPPVLYYRFVTTLNLKNDGTTKLVFDSWDNQKAALGLSDDDWANNTNNVQESETSATASTNLRDGIKVFKVGTTAYVLAKKNLPVAFPINSTNLFASMTALESIEFNSINTSKATNMAAMFASCSKLTSLDLSEFDTSNVTTMLNMFQNCSALTELNTSSFNTSKVINMSNMFQNCSAFTELDVSSFDTSKVTNMMLMFNGCSKLKQLTFGEKFDTSSVTTMAGMFQNCSAFTELDVSKFVTTSVNSMGSMFNGCSGLTSLDLSGFDTGTVTNMGSMFMGCSSLRQLTFGEKFDTSSVTTMAGIFQNCSAFTEIDLSKFNTTKVTNMSSMFNGCSGLTSLDLSSFNTTKVTNMLSMFNSCSALRQITLGKDFRFVGTNGYLPAAAEGYAWYVKDSNIPLTPAEVASNQTTVTAATTYIKK